MPPNHNTAMAICDDHAGIAAGFPRALTNAEMTPSALDKSVSGIPSGDASSNDITLLKQPSGTLTNAANHNTTRAR